MGSEILGLARYGLDPIAWRKVRESFGGKGDIYIPMPVIGGGGGGGGGGGDGGVGGHSWVALWTEGSSFER